MLPKFKTMLGICLAFVLMTSCGGSSKDSTQDSSLTSAEVINKLPRKETPKTLTEATNNYVKALRDGQVNMHSIMIVKKGNVLYERYMGEGAPDKPHELWSVSKTFTSIAVGLAINEGYIKLSDKVVSFFPNDLPEKPSKNLKRMTIKDLLTMSCGHDTDPSSDFLWGKSIDTNWVKEFLAYPVDHKPGTYFCYNSMSTYMLSAIVQKVTGQKVVDYLGPRLFTPLGIDMPKWDSSPQDINCGGWGLYLKTEDLAKVGQLLLQKGKWGKNQIIPKKWVKEMSSKQIDSRPAAVTPQQVKEWNLNKKNSDWVQGYGYQMWRSRHNSFRADGAYGQGILVLPDKDAVIAVTAKLDDMQKEFNFIWDYILPAI